MSETIKSSEIEFPAQQHQLTIGITRHFQPTEHGATNAALSVDGKISSYNKGMNFARIIEKQDRDLVINIRHSDRKRCVQTAFNFEAGFRKHLRLADDRNVIIHSGIFDSALNPPQETIDYVLQKLKDLDEPTTELQRAYLTQRFDLSELHHPVTPQMLQEHMENYMRSMIYDILQDGPIYPIYLWLFTHEMNVGSLKQAAFPHLDATKIEFGETLFFGVDEIDGPVTAYSGGVSSLHNM